MKDIKEYLPFYLGRKMLYATHHEPQSEPYILTLDNIKEAIEYGDTLLLRPLSIMTEEEAIELFKLEYPYIKVNWISIELKKEEVRPLHEKLNIEPSYRVHCKYLSENGKESGVYGSLSMKEFNSDQFTYLLSKGFDLFNLIPEGLALDITTQKT